MDIGQINSKAPILPGNLTLKTFKAGETFIAKIIDMSSEILQLRTSDGSILNAVCENKMNFILGESVKLFISDVKDNKLIVRVLGKNHKHSEEEIKSQLANMGIKAAGTNQKIAQALNEFGLDITPENIEVIKNAIAASDNSLSPKIAAFMLSKSIPFTSDNNDAIQLAVNNDLNILSAMKEIQTAIDNLNDLQLLNQIQNKLSEYSNISSLVNNMPDMEDLPVSTRNDLLKSLPLFIADNKEEYGTENVVKFLDASITGFDKLPFGTRQNLLSVIMELFHIAKTETNTKENIQAPKEFIKDFFVRAFLKLDDKGLMTENRDKLSSYVIKDGIEIIRTVSGSNINILNEGFSPVIETAFNNISFLSEMGKFCSYCQIPFFYNDNENMGELYIMKRKGNKSAINADNVAFLVAIDTNNMGRVEALVEVKNKIITIAMRLESNEKIDFSKKYYKELFEKFQALGYSLAGIKYKLLNEKTTAINADKIISRESHFNYRKIDFRV